MANQKISQLTNGNPAVGTDQIPINRGGANFSITAGSIATLAGGATPLAGAASVQLAAQAALIAGTTLFTPTVDSVYLATLAITGQVASTTPTDTLLAHFVYTSPYSGTAIATGNSSAVTFNANLNSNGFLVVVIHCKASTAVQYATSGGTQAGTGWQYALDVTAIRLF